MWNNLTETTIGQTCYVTDGAHTKVKRQTEGILYLTSKNIGAGRLILDKVDYISKEDYERLFSDTSKAQRRPRDGDILIGIIGTFGNAYRYKQSDVFGISSAVAILRPQQDVVDSDFLYYIVTSSRFKSIHESYKSGSVQGYTNIPTIKQLPFLYPPMTEQKAIANILGTLDDKIELNCQMNATLEAMAQALFKSWFVDFDPVIDNELAAGNPIPDALQKRVAARVALGDRRQPLPAEIQTQFPSRFVFDEEMGWVPEGWRVVNLHDLGEVNRGRSRHRPRYAEHLYNGPYPFIQTGDVKASNGLITQFEQSYSEAGLAQSRLWPLGTMCITIAANIAETSILTFPACFPDSVIGFIPDRDQCNVNLVRYTFENIKERIQNEATGSVQKNINLGTLKSIKFCLPPPSAIPALSKDIDSLVAQIQANREQSQNLAKLRDTLLPKLLSGQLRVPDAERLV